MPPRFLGARTPLAKLQMLVTPDRLIFGCTSRALHSAAGESLREQRSVRETTVDAKPSRRAAG